MARYTGPSCKLCRREGKKLFLKGERCYTNKCSFERRSYAPGQHGQSRKKASEYGLQLRAKQQAKRYYGIAEGQFLKYFEMATKREGVTGEVLFQICETRLDNVVYLLGWANSRAQARQLVNHGHFEVNGKRVDIPSFLTKEGDVITFRKKSLESTLIKGILEENETRPVSAWLSLDRDKKEGKVISLPTREQIEVPVEEHLIVEFYSR